MTQESKNRFFGPLRPHALRYVLAALLSRLLLVRGLYYNQDVHTQRGD
jgi:hypothetical protein